MNVHVEDVITGTSTWSKNTKITAWIQLVYHFAYNVRKLSAFVAMSIMIRGELFKEKNILYNES